MPTMPPTTAVPSGTLLTCNLEPNNAGPPATHKARSADMVLHVSGSVPVSWLLNRYLQRVRSILRGWPKSITWLRTTT